jgi:DNA-binding IclR family transcriptional regulator
MGMPVLDHNTALEAGSKALKALPSAEGSSRKVLRALLAFSVETPRHTAESLAACIGLPLSSTYRYLNILKEAALIDEESRGCFVLATRVLALAQAARAGTGLVSIARPRLRSLSRETGETVMLLRRSGNRAVCLERFDASSRFQMTFEVGVALPLYRGAAPKMLLAHLPEAQIEATLDDAVASDPAFAPHRTALRNELTTIRQQGWSESRAEITPHVVSGAVGIVDDGDVVAAVCFVAPIFRTPKGAQNRLMQHLLQAAADITRAFEVAV